MAAASTSAGLDDARALLHVPPDEYIAERTRLVKAARAAKDRERATALQALKKPNLAMWAVLVAGADAGAVRTVIESTAELASVQAGGAGRAELAATTQRRREAVEALVDSGVKALTPSETRAAAEGRRAEIRTLVDQLSRHPEVADAWVEGTLRDLPEEGFGFGAFADVDVPEPAARAERAVPVKRSSRGHVVAPEPKQARTIDLKAEREARRAVSAAERELSTAQRRLAAAQADFDRAQEELAGRQREHDAAQDKVDDAQAALRKVQARDE